MNESADPGAWAAYAEEDYLLAQSALRRKRPLSHGACFHAQQCAEKYLKALLLVRDQAFPKTHDLLLLSELCSQARIMVPVSPDLLDTLSMYAVQVRYPGAAPTEEDARRALEIARSVRRFARRLMGL